MQHANVTKATYDATKVQCEATYAAAEGLLRRAAALDPGDPAALCNLGLLVAQLHQRDEEAEVLLRRAAALAPARPEALCNLGLLHCSSGLLRSAEELLLRALSLAPDCVPADRTLRFVRRLIDRQRIHQLAQSRSGGNAVPSVTEPGGTPGALNSLPTEGPLPPTLGPRAWPAGSVPEESKAGWRSGSQPVQSYSAQAYSSTSAYGRSAAPRAVPAAAAVDSAGAASTTVQSQQQMGANPAETAAAMNLAARSTSGDVVSELEPLTAADERSAAEAAQGRPADEHARDTNVPSSTTQKIRSQGPSGRAWDVRAELTKAASAVGLESGRDADAVIQDILRPCGVTQEALGALGDGGAHAARQQSSLKMGHTGPQPPNLLRPPPPQAK